MCSLHFARLPLHPVTHLFDLSGPSSGEWLNAEECIKIQITKGYLNKFQYYQGVLLLTKLPNTGAGKVLIGYISI